MGEAKRRAQYKEAHPKPKYNTYVSVTGRIVTSADQQPNMQCIDPPTKVMEGEILPPVQHDDDIHRRESSNNGNLGMRALAMAIMSDTMVIRKR